MIHPAKNLAEGRRYIVALRKMKGSKGQLLKSSRAFAAALRSGHRHSARYDSTGAGCLVLGSTARRSTWRGTSAPPASAGSASAHVSIRDNTFGDLGDSNLVDRKIKGAPAGLQDRLGPGLRAVRRRRLPGRRERPAAAPRERHDDDGLLARQARLPGGLQVPLPQARRALRLRVPPGAPEGQHDERAVRVHDPARRGGEEGARRRSTATTSSAARRT